MKIIKPSATIENKMCAKDAFKHIERCGRTCYKSEDKITGESAKDFVARIIRSGHESVLEHVSVTMRIVCDRGVSHELVRHRIASFSQESTRYCNYSIKERFGNEITVIKPCFFDERERDYELWASAMVSTEFAYFTLLENGASPQEARSVLPNSLKTELVITANLREWRHILKLRTAKDAHPQCIEVMNMVKKELTEWLPEVFNV